MSTADKSRILREILRDADSYLGPIMLVTKNNLKFNYDKFNEKRLLAILSSLGWKKGERVAYLSTYSANYTRTESLQDLFFRLNVDIDYYIYPKSYFSFLFNLIRIRSKYRFFFVAFRGHEVLPFVRIIAGRRKKIIFDAFVSVYDTLCYDRCVINPKLPLGKFLKWYDKFLGTISDTVLVDTCAHRQYFESEFELNNVDYLYVGCNKKLFHKMDVPKNSKFTVFWYGHANPLQGVDNILRWAESLKARNDIQFVLVGPINEKYAKSVNTLSLRNVQFISYLQYNQLPKFMNGADLCLGGHFSDIPKAKRVIAGKTFQMIHCGCHTLVARNVANCELYE